MVSVVGRGGSWVQEGSGFVGMVGGSMVGIGGRVGELKIAQPGLRGRKSAARGLGAFPAPGLLSEHMGTFTE